MTTRRPPPARPPSTIHPSGALLLGADYRALGAARSLGRHGVPVWVLAEPSEPLASVSRFARRNLRWPVASDADRAAFLGALARSEGLSGWALIPSSDAMAAMVARHHAELSEHFTVTSPPWEVIQWAYDKRLTHELADRVGVPSPFSVCPDGDLPGTTAEMPFPAVVKPAIKEQANALTTAKAWRVDTPQELERRYAEACRLLPRELIIVQELIPGGGAVQLSYAALCRDGKPLASLTARRTRQYPADFGRASTFVETVDCPEVVEPSKRLLAEIGYTGLIEVEYKRDPRDGELKLLDMNPRLWGWHSLCARAGVDFPWLQWLMITGQPLPVANARSGIGWRRFTTDTPTAVRELLARRLSVRDYARSLRWPRESAIFAWDDPLPGLLELPVLTYVLAQRLWHGEAV